MGRSAVKARDLKTCCAAPRSVGQLDDTCRDSKRLTACAVQSGANIRRMRLMLVALHIAAKNRTGASLQKIAELLVQDTAEVAQYFRQEHVPERKHRFDQPVLEAAIISARAQDHGRRSEVKKLP
jgi:hypothetical protein